MSQTFLLPQFQHWNLTKTLTNEIQCHRALEEDIYLIHQWHQPFNLEFTENVSTAQLHIKSILDERKNSRILTRT